MKTATALFKMYDSIVMDVRPQNVVQFIADNSTACVAVMKLLTDKYVSILFAPCATHCLDLTLEDIGKYSWVKGAFQKAHTVTKFMYNHMRVLSLMF